MATKGERRENKRKKAWYKKRLSNNRKSIEILVEAIRKRGEQNGE